MKKYRIIIFYLLILSFFTSCKKDFLELSPLNNRLEENFYKNEQDMQGALVAVYDVLQWDGFHGYIPEQILSDVASDDTYAGGANASDQPSWVALDNFTLTPTLGPQAAIWGRYYSGIYRANLYLEKIPGADVTQEFSDRTIAEVKFLRAYYYFQLERWFGRIPLILKTLNPSEYNFPQSEPAAVYAQIEKDLNEAIPNLPLQVSDAEKGRVTKGAAQSLLARVILFQNDDQRMTEVKNLTEAVIQSGVYALVPDFSTLWDTHHRNTSESVFEIQHSEKSSWGDWGYLQGSEGNIGTQMIGMRDYSGATYVPGWGFCPVTEDLVNVLKDDPRFDATIIDASQGSLGTDGFFHTQIDGQDASYKPGYQNTGYFNKKYAPLKENLSPDGNTMLNWKNNVLVIRYADVLLMAAEAENRTGDDADALVHLNAVRQRVGLPDVSLGGAALLDAIYLERRKEFALEGIRYWDLIRTQKAGDALGSQGWKQGVSNHLPIPQSEIDNTNHILTQNPGY